MLLYIMEKLNSRTVTILEVGFGNLPSLKRVLNQIDAKVEVALTPIDILTANYLIIPGVGSFGTAMNYLKSNKLEEAIKIRSLEKRLPTLGICLGAQIMLEVGYEGGKNSGLGIFAGSVQSLESSAGIEVTHTGWDKAEIKDDFLGIEKNSEVNVFFNHDFVLMPKDFKDIYGTCNFGTGFAVALSKFKTFAVQFHPEKSQLVGLKMLEYFLKLDNV